MNLQTFKSSTEDTQPPVGVSPVLIALWHEAKGDWDAAHRIAQAQANPQGDWVHAYLHRVEGDEGNAAYWYRRVGKDFCTLELADEWDQIVEELINAQP